MESGAILAELKAALNEAIDLAQPDGTYLDADYALVHELIKRLTPLTPTPRPIDEQEFVEGCWGSRFAQYAVRHTAGKPIRHQSKLSLQSFNRFPPIDVIVKDVDQEIRVAGRHYNNVVDVSSADGQHDARIIVWGSYDLQPEEPQRYIVNFYAVEIVPPEGVSGVQLREQFGLDADCELRRELKPMKLHSDVVYCDEDLRINIGSMGGIYVLNRLSTAGKSVTFG